ncbi:MAG: hypothetical protein QXU32_11880 [Nitrososphaerales archaeon]
MKGRSAVEQLKRIPHGTLVRVMWLDASTVKGARLKVPLPNYYVETRRTTIGSYIALQSGKSQKAYHLILEMDNTEGSGSMIRSIPACLIYKIIVTPVKQAESTERMEFASKRHTLSKERASIRLKDGSVKIFD